MDSKRTSIEQNTIKNNSLTIKQVPSDNYKSNERRSKRLLDLIDRTGYPIIQTNGQRTFGPPPNWIGPSPPKGSEIFVGKLPRHIFEDTLVPLFSKVGTIFEMRLMMNFAGLNRGYAFVKYFNQEDANQAVRKYNHYEICPHVFIGVYKSVDNCRLFVGGIPSTKAKEEVHEALSQYVDGLTNVIMYQAYFNKVENRGFVFAEFDSHKSAAMARRKLGHGSLILWGEKLSVDWADPLPEVDPYVMSKVTKLYIRNLEVNMSHMDLWTKLAQHIPQFNIVKVHKVMDYAFVHFTSRKNAEHALNVLQGQWFGANQIEVTWARPKIYSKKHRMNATPENFCTSLPPRMRKQVLMKAKGPDYVYNNLYDSNPDNIYNFKSPQLLHGSSIYGCSAESTSFFRGDESVVNVTNLNMFSIPNVPLDIQEVFAASLKL